MERQSRPGDPPGVVRRAFPGCLIAPDPDLFHEGHDPHDRKLGAAVARDTAAYDKARIVLIGCPQDVGVRRNRGRPGSESAPQEIRRQLYRLATPDSVADGALLDAGDVDTASSLKEIREIGVEKSFRSVLHRRAHEVEAIFWGFDMDAVRSADAPGVSAGNPVGFTAAEVCGIAAEAGRAKRTRILEISECNPEQDIDGRTAKLAAMMIVSYLEALDPETLETA